MWCEKEYVKPEVGKLGIDLFLLVRLVRVFCKADCMIVISRILSIS